MYTLRILTIAAIKMFVRNKQALFFTFFMPFIIMGVFGLIGFDNFGTIQLGVAVENPTPATQEFIDQLEEVEVFTVTQGTEPDERAALEEGDRSLVIVLPSDLVPTPGTADVEQREITALLNAGEPQQAQTGLSIINQMLSGMNLAITQSPNIFSVVVEEVQSSNLRYIDFLIPGIVALAVMQMGVFSVAFLFADYKEKGILRRLMATPMKPTHFVTANVITRLLVALGQTGVLLGVSILLFDFAVAGSYLLVLLIAILGGIMFLGLGFSISGISKTVESVPAIANLIVFPMLFLGGTFFPLESMPEWLANIVQYMPLTYFSESLRAVMNTGAGFADVATEIYWMMGWSVVLVGLAIMTFKFEGKRV